MNYKELKELLIRANTAYYIESSPIMSDYEFDMKLKELEKLEEQQGYADPDSPTRKPGSDLSTVDLSNNHGRPMLSLENTYTKEEIEKWYSDMIKATGDAHPEVVVNMKWDGGSGALRYREGRLVKALTRGSGEVGEDITQNIQYCDENVWTPKASKIGFTIAKFTGEARGEIIMTSEGFNEINSDGRYQNARNLLSGSLKLLDIYEFIPRADKIKFYAYWLEDSQNKKYSEDLEELKRFGFTVGDYYLCHSLEDIFTAIDVIEFNTYDVAIDGAVLKLNNKAYWDQLGSTAKAPRWAKAYKYKQESAETRVNNITFEVGRTGKITPLCWFEPVFLDGSTVQKATLNNEDFYRTMDVAIGDTVEVQKAAAIIPQIISINNRPKDRRVIPFPKVCPVCGSKLEKHNEDHADYYCNNSNCKARVVDQIINYTRALEIDGFAEVIVERLNAAGLLCSISDLYRLKNYKEEIGKLERLSVNMATKLCNNIESSKSADFGKVISALGIPNVGPKTAKLLAKKFKNIDSLIAANTETLKSLEDIGDIVADSIVNFFNENTKFIAELKDFGVFSNVIVEEKQTESLSGITFCITGALSSPRATYVERIERFGGKVVDSVSRKTNYLVTNTPDSGSSKNKKAKELGIPVITETELEELLK